MSTYAFGCLILATSGGGEVVTEWTLSPDELLWRLGLVLLIITINSFFVVSEFAMVKVRESQLKQREREGVASASLALKIARNLEGYLSATQLGITLMSIAIGSVGEPVFASILQPLIYHAGVSSPAIIHTLATICSVACVTFLQVVLGEQTPKRLAIRWPLNTSLWIARPLHIVYLVLVPFTRVLNFATDLVLRTVFRVKSSGDGSSAHSGEELRHIVAESQRSKEVTETERDILLNALALNELFVRDIMTPRNQVVCLDIGEPFEDMVQLAIKHQHTRYPVVEGHLDHPLGLVHIKDLLRVMNEGSRDLRKALRELPEVPEMLPIDKLLRTFLDRHAHFAIVLDEFGGTVGAVTLDNVVEEIVGDIQDEFDAENPEFERINADEFLVDGMLNLYELKDLAGIVIESDEVTTVSGYITAELGHLPKVGETLDLVGYRVEVVKAGQRRVEKLRFTRLAQEEQTDNGDDSLADSKA